MMIWKKQQKIYMNFLTNMSNKEKIVDKIEKLWNNGKNWTPPSYSFMAKKIGVSKGLIARYIKLLRNENRI